MWSPLAKGGNQSESEILNRIETSNSNTSFYAQIPNFYLWTTSFEFYSFVYLISGNWIPLSFISVNFYNSLTISTIVKPNLFSRGTSLPIYLSLWYTYSTLEVKPYLLSRNPNLLSSYFLSKCKENRSNSSVGESADALNFRYIERTTGMRTPGMQQREVESSTDLA